MRDDRAGLLLLTDELGSVYGTESLSLFLHSFVRMQGSGTIVELGTGLGVSALWMALAIKCNKLGHLWTVDDFTFSATDCALVEQAFAKLRNAGVTAAQVRTACEYYSEISRIFDCDSVVTFINSKIGLDEANHFEKYSFAGRTIDLLFSDICHGPENVLRILAHFLHRMSPSASILIHSASTCWSSYLLLEHLAGQLSVGKIPAALQNLSRVDLQKVVENRKFTLVHLTEQKTTRQNSCAWI